MTEKDMKSVLIYQVARTAAVGVFDSIGIHAVVAARQKYKSSSLYARDNESEIRDEASENRPFDNEGALLHSRAKELAARSVLRNKSRGTVATADEER